jgi:EcsC protein family
VAYSSQAYCLGMTLPQKSLAVPNDKAKGSLITQAVLRVAGHVPKSTESVASEPRLAAQRLTRTAAQNAALTSSTLAMAPGPLGLLTLIPDLVAVWKIQAQLVADIAAVYGSNSQLTQEHMLFCLFKHAASQAIRDVFVRAGERFIIKHLSLGVLQSLAKQIGLKISQRVVGNGVSRFVPILGAVGVGGYAYYDTTKVAATAISLFESKIKI